MIFSGVQFLWVFFCLVALLPGAIYFVYYHRPLGTRRTLLLQTILSMGLDDAYMRTRHRHEHEKWYSLPDKKSRMQDFESKYFNEDFRAGTAVQDYLLPVLLFTILTLLGWLFIFYRLAPGMSPHIDVPKAVFPDAWAFGFVGAYLACLLTLFNGFRQYDLDPSVYYTASYRLMFNSLAAYLVSFVVKESFGLALFSRTVG
jgi:hypothetical protein